MFLNHEACDKCGSSDGKAVYQGGSSWCFVCHTYKRGNVFYETKKKEAKSLPSDLSQRYSREVIDWISKYEITIEDLIRENISYSEHQRALYFIWKDEAGQLLGWQRRNFRGQGPKYTSSGGFDGIFPFYGLGSVLGVAGTSETPEIPKPLLVLTEDCLSAIKASKTAQVASMPCLTSSLSTSKLKRLVSQFGAFLVWLDGNMFDNAQKTARMLQLMGAKARAVYTPLDPKCYSSSKIREIISNNCNQLLT